MNLLIWTGGITKTVTLTTTFCKVLVEANPYVQFVYDLLVIFNHIPEEVSVSINSNPINLIHTSQQSTIKELYR